MQSESVNLKIIYHGSLLCTTLFPETFPYQNTEQREFIFALAASQCSHAGPHSKRMFASCRLTSQHVPVVSRRVDILP